MTWYWFNWLAPAAIICWLAAAWAALRRKNPEIFMAAGLAVFTVFIIGLWAELERPPMRTLGETRLWYSFFLAAAGWLAYRKWKYHWLPAFSAVLAGLFAALNLFRPEMHSIALRPALQSHYFIPHVVTYMLSYAVLAVAAGAGLAQLRKISREGEADRRLHAFLDNVVHMGLGFLMLGLISGAAWAKEAWGHYWSWDPKETWAFVTAAAYLLYIHLRLRDARPALTLLILPLGFLLLMITWLGVSLLPSASGSVHVY